MDDDDGDEHGTASDLDSMATTYWCATPMRDINERQLDDPGTKAALAGQGPHGLYSTVYVGGADE